jgi:hypothetical protein
MGNTFISRKEFEILSSKTFGLVKIKEQYIEIKIYF